MLSVAEAHSVVLNHLLVTPAEPIPLPQAAGRVLREPLTADRDLPPFNRVSMDGIAIQYAAFETGQRQFRVAGTQFAGQPAQTLTNETACLEVMTGAMLPTGTDTVIRYEDLQITDGLAEIRIDAVQAGQNVHHRATDRKQNEELVPIGTRLGPPEMAVAASVGKATILVSKRPKIALISTGDELVDVSETPEPYQIRRSNTYLLQTVLQAAGAETTLLHLPDDADTMETALKTVLQEYDALVLSGGVSAGKADFVPNVMERLGVRQRFHQVAQRPGKPLWFGASDEGKVVFGLPGNPVSTFLCAYRYLLPWLKASLGLPVLPPSVARLARSVSFPPQLTYFLPVRLSVSPDGIGLAAPLPGSGSADYANLLQCDGFMELPPERAEFSEGEAFPVYTFR
ncbi:molybdopterin molybdotransferase MoeA [Larkinella humicola]|uniref:Molybdopterin molybdenumtransferase n=1 Tax=Larkinella humicola TaxID=2607654 RepID=A0A5N1J8H9_9BACT|nr:molybdopterin molybdotransferase MoeA [Larkinella humicola]KAA9346411.1 molybdopterin molybdotransferase MoeA [Larkinella humicola]